MTALGFRLPVRRLWAHSWWLAVLAAIMLVTWSDHARRQRIDYVTNQAIWSVDPPAVDAHSPTGYQHGWRRLIMPNHPASSFRWIIETQQMVEKSEWRIRHIDYTNAPAGHDTHLANAYHWWLLSVAWIDHLLTGASLGRAIEHAALYSDPVLHLLLMVSAAWFTSVHFGKSAGALVALGLAALFPLTAGFQPGAPDAHSLSIVCGFWSVLPILATLVANERTGGVKSANDRSIRTPRAYFVIAGVAGGFGLWIDARTQAPLLVGIAIGSVAQQIVLRRLDASALPAGFWRAWSVAGSITSLAAYFLEYFPSHLQFSVHGNHPAIAVAWLGIGELLVLFQPGTADQKRTRLACGFAALAAVAVLPIILATTDSFRLLADDVLASRLANLRDPIEALSVRDWIRQSGFDHYVLATGAPLALLVFGTAMLARRKHSAAIRAAAIVTAGPAAVSIALALVRLRWWSMVDILVMICVALLLADAAAKHRATLARWGWIGLTALAWLPGLFLSDASIVDRAHDPLTEREARTLIERDVSYWLAARVTAADNLIVLAAPSFSESLVYFAGIKTVATLDPENEGGFNAAVRMASATTLSEAAALLQNRGVTQIVIPSWDSGLEDLARIGLGDPSGSDLPLTSFAMAIRDWHLPPWTRPIPYFVAKADGFSDLSIAVLEIVPPQEPALALSRLAEYYVDLERRELASVVREPLKLYPRNVVALGAQARAAFALGNTAEFSQLLEQLRPLLARRSARSLPFDQRLSLALVLTAANAPELVQEQLRLAMREVDEADLRALGSAGLVRLLALSRHYNIPFPNERLRTLALQLLPPQLRERVLAP